MLQTAFGVLIMAAAITIAIPAYATIRRESVEARNRAAAAAAILGTADGGDKGAVRPSKMQEALDKAGIEVTAGYFAGAVAFFTVAIGFLAATIGGSPAMAGVGLFVPLLALMRIAQRSKSRADEFEGQLAEALPMVAGGMRTGLTFEAAMANVADYMPDPLSEQFKRAAAERSYGVPLADAMENMSHRVNCPDMGLLTAVTAVQQETGGNMADVLDSIAETIRRRLHMRKHIASVTAEGRLSAAIMAGIPVVLLVALTFLTPSYVDVFYTTPAGWAMLAVAALLDVMGLLFIRKLYNMKIY